MNLYTINGPTFPDWGDYSDVLVAGLASRLNRENALLQLERTRSFVPPITIPHLSEIIVTNELKVVLEKAQLSGMTFLPIIKKRIVFLEWEKWDLAADEPEEYPESGEPEDYILQKPHSKQLAQQMGELWEISLEDHAELIPYQGISNWDGTDIFRVKGQLTPYASEAAKAFLETVAAHWITFQAAPVA